MGRRRRRATDSAGNDDFIDAMFEIARMSPAIGLGLAAVLFAGGAFLFWGDPKRWMGVGPIAGIPLLLLAFLVAGAAVIFYLRDRIATRGNAESPAGIADAPVQPAPVRPNLSTTTRSPAPAAVAPRDGRAFERLVAHHFRAQGYTVEETGTHGTGGDRGIDLLLRRPDSPAATPATVCVQCKDYAQWKVGAPAVREFASAVRLRGPGHVGWIVTTGRFTSDAVRDAAQLDLRLIDGDAWSSMQGAGDATASTAAPPAATAADVPRCPTCRTPMVRREPKPGGKQFQPFWGCANYPRCRATVDIA